MHTHTNNEQIVEKGRIEVVFKEDNSDLTLSIMCPDSVTRNIVYNVPPQLTILSLRLILDYKTSKGRQTF